MNKALIIILLLYIVIIAACKEATLPDEPTDPGTDPVVTTPPEDSSIDDVDLIVESEVEIGEMI